MKKPIAQISRVERYMAKRPNAKPKEVADALDLPLKSVYNYRSLINKKNIQLQAMDDVERFIVKPDFDFDTAKKIHRLSRGKRMQGRDHIVSLNPLPDVFKNPRQGETVDNVNHPPHYKVGGIETIDFIEAKELGYNLGNVIKYISRASHKHSYAEDLKKARWYLDREIMKQHVGK